MQNSVFVTGATGVVGKAIAKIFHNNKWDVIGTGRKRPANWNYGEFVEFDLTSGNLTSLSNSIEKCSIVIHLCDLTKYGADVNSDVAVKLFNISNSLGIQKFFYASSIRVYTGHFGEIDEKSKVNPAKGDIYGISKAKAEQCLIGEKIKNDTTLILVRLGNIFSSETKEKYPKEEKLLTRILYRGMNRHLISADNVAFAVFNLANKGRLKPLEIVNITQEAVGENDYFLLIALLAGKPYRKKSISKLEMYCRYILTKFRNELNGGYYILVAEKRLQELQIIYPLTLIESLLKEERTNAEMM